MNNKSLRFRIVDVLLIVMMILPLVAGMAIKVLTTPASEGIEISGARIYATIPMPVQDLPITESQVNSWLVMISILGLCLYLAHGIAVRPQSKRQLVAEWAVEKVNGLIADNMGQRFMGFAPFVAAIMVLSAFSSLMSLVGLRPPTSDMNVVAGWAIVVFLLITHYKLKGGLWPYVKGFFEPVPVFAPFNIIGEFATPVSMSFRHYGNVLSGVVISTLVAAALQGLSKLLLGWLPGLLGEIPFLQVGLPAILSLYFDIFSGVMQAFIFAMLTMLYIATGFPEEEYEQRKAKRKKRALNAA
mgnify:FL=1